MDLGIALGLVGIAIGLVALAVAIPPFIQMVWGKADLSIDFDHSAEQGTKLLLGRIHNRAVTNRFFRVLGVTRSPAKAFAIFDILEHGTKKIVASGFRAKLIDLKSGEEGITLPVEEPLPVLFVIAEHSDKGACVINHAPPKEIKVALPPGEYFAEVSVGFHGGVIAALRSFSIAADKDATDWTWRKIPR